MIELQVADNVRVSWGERVTHDIAEIPEGLHKPGPGSVEQLQALLLSQPETHVEPEYRHTFAPGVYVREMHIPAGCVAVGKRHKTEHVAMLVKGRITILTDDGIQTLEAPVTMVSRAGIKRVGYAHTDVVFVNIHPTNETDLDKIEAEVIEPEPLPAIGGPLAITQEH